MDTWSQVILEWVNCLELLDAPISSLEELHDGKFYKKLISLLSCEKKDYFVNNEDFIYEFIQEEYPDFLVGDHINHTLEDIYITSLLLLRTSQEHTFQRPMCLKLQVETQVKIKIFLEYVLRYGKDLTIDVLKMAISELADDAPKTPPSTPKVRPLKKFFDSPVARSARNNRLANEHSREIRRLESALEAERFEKFDLQDSLNAERKKVQNLERRYSDKSKELEALREELRSKFTTPRSSAKKQNSRETIERYRKEIKSLEEYSASLRAELDKLTDENENLTKNLASSTRQFSSLKEKFERTELSLETLSIRSKLKERELLELGLQNQELRSHLQEIRKASMGEQSFEVDCVAAADSSLRLPNDGEALSSVIDIQLQEAREEAHVLRTRLEGMSRQLESVDREWRAAKQLNITLQEKANTVEILRKELLTVKDELHQASEKVLTLEKEKSNALNEIDILRCSFESQELLLKQTTNERDEINEKLNDSRQHLSNLKAVISRVENNAQEYLHTIQNLKLEHSRYQENIENCVRSLKNSIIRGFGLITDNDINLELPTIMDIPKKLESLITSIESLQKSKETEIKNLNTKVIEMEETISSLNETVCSLERKDKENILKQSKLLGNIKDSDLRIINLEDTVLEYSDRINVLEEYVAKLNTENSLLKSNIDSATKNTKEFFAQFAELTMNFDLELSNLTILELSNQFGDLLTALESMNNSKETQIKQLEVELKELNTVISKLKNTINILEKRDQDNISELSTMVKNLKEYDLKIKNFEGAVLEYTSKIKNLKENIEQAETEKSHLKSNIEYVTRITTEFMNQIARLSMEHDLELKDLTIGELSSQFTDLIISLKSANDSKKTEIKELDIKLVEANATILTLKDTICSMERKNEENILEQTKLLEEIKNSDLKIKNFESSMLEYSKSINSLQEKIEELKSKNSCLNSDIQNISTDTKEFMMKIARLSMKDDLNLNDCPPAELSTQFIDLLTSLESLYDSKEKQIKEFDIQLKDVNTTISTLKEKVKNMEQKDEENTSELTKISDHLQASAEKIIELEETVLQYSIEKADTLKEFNVERESLINTINELQRDLCDRKSVIESLTLRVKDLENEKDTLCEEFESSKHIHSQKLIEYELQSSNSIQKLSERYQILQKELEELSLERENLNSEITTKDENLKTAQQRNVELQTLLSEKTEINNEININMLKLKNDLERLNVKIEQLESEKKSLEDRFQMTNIETDKLIESLKLRISGLSMDLNSLREEKDSLRRRLSTALEEMKSESERNEALLSEREHHRIENERLLEQQRQRELQMKEIVVNLQEIRANRDAVLEAQALALQESNHQLEELRKEFQVAKAALEEELQKEKLSKSEIEKMYNVLQVKCIDLENRCVELENKCANLETKCGDLENNYGDLENKCDVLRNNLSDTMNKCTLLENKCSDLKKNCKDFETKCTNLENNCTYMENKNTDLEKKYTDLMKKCCDFENRISDDSGKLKKLEDNLMNEKLELKTIKECCRNLIQRKESLWELISKVITLRNLLNSDVNSVKEYWIEVLEKFQDFWSNDPSICDESKQLRIKKEELQKKILDLNRGYLDCLLPIMDITWESFLWTEKNLQTSFLAPRFDSGEDLESKDFQQDIKNIDLKNSQSILIVEMEKFDSLRNDVATVRKEIENFANSVSSYETNLKIIQEETKLKEKQVVDKSLKENKELKEKLDLFRGRNIKLEKNLDDLRNEIKKLKAEKSSEEGNKELTDHIESLKDDIRRLQVERDELSKRPKEEDFDKRLKDVHEEYGQKLEKLKLKMKAAYNEQVEKLNRDQDKTLQEKIGSMQMKMTEQYRKHAEEIEKYKKHVTDMTNKYWDVSEKFLNEKHEKEAALKKLQEYKTKSKADNFTQPYSYDQMAAMAKNRTSSLDRKDFANDSLEDSSRRTSRTVQVIEEETTYARRRSVRSIQTMGNAFKAEDEEGEIFDNVYLADLKQGRDLITADPDRLSILQQRNALCKPHLKSSYPAETQFHSTILSEEDIKHGLGADDVFNDSLSQSLLPGQKTKKRDRTQTSYKRPGPPTPSKNGGRLSLQGNELFSPKSRILRERNIERRTTTTPRTLKDLFSSSSSRRKDENVTGTPRARRLSIFRKNSRPTSEKS